MSLRVYFVLITVCVWMFGVNSQSANAGGRGSVPRSFSPRFNRPGPQNFFSGIGSALSCPYSATIDCSTATEYRTIDGSCNNKANAYIGKSDTPYIRVKPAAYVDKKPRTKNYFGKPLPTPREVTLKYFIDEAAGDPPSTKLTNAAAVFARFVEHDLYKTRLVDVTSDCCPTSATSTGKCNNIEVKSDDPFFNKYKVTCLPKPSMIESADISCKTDVTQQVNLHTHYLDLSNIYGSTTAKSAEVRNTTDGLLKVTVNGAEKLLPKTTEKPCNTQSTENTCFLAGDSRANNDPLLMTMYTIWVRFHNEIAKKVKGTNPEFDNEKIFQEARKIVIAVYQHIVYNELLFTLNPGTKLKPTADFTNPGANTESQIANYFSIAFTGLADTIAQKEFTVGTDKVKLEESWYKPDAVWKTDGVKNIAEGMLKDAAGKIDRLMAKPLYDQYLQIAAGNGTDKIALNFQQQRENGLITYYVQTAVLRSKYDMQKFADLTTLEAKASTELQKLYDYIYDIEFLPGLLGESPSATGKVLGPLMEHILEEQFKSLRDGDKFYYLHKDNFDADKVKEIQKMTMGALMCQYAKILKARTSVFKPIEGTDNPETDCSTLTEKTKVLDMCKWANTGWTEWSDTACRGGIIFRSRQCQFAADIGCECDGSPVQIKPCPIGIQRMISGDTKRRLEREFSLYFDDQGHPRPGVYQKPQDVARNILDRNFPH